MSNSQPHDEDDDFYTMMGKKASKLSPDTQIWLQDQCWKLYMTARSMDTQLITPSITPQNITPAFPFIYSMQTPESQYTHISSHAQHADN